MNFMKKISWFFLTLPFVLIACNNQNKDSVEKADSANQAKADTSNTMDTTSTTKGVLGVDESTASFLVKVADGGKTEVELGKIAQEKAASKRVKEFGAMMVQDHTKAGEELKTLATKENVTLPDSVSSDHRKKIDDLKKKTGKDFDKAYMDMMEDDHESTVRDFENNKDNKYPDVKDFVNKTLPTLHKHLDSAKSIKKELK
jgi:putative membrane protein